MDVFNLTNNNTIQGVRTTQNASNANQMQAITRSAGAPLRHPVQLVIRSMADDRVRDCSKAGPSGPAFLFGHWDRWVIW